MHHIKNISQKKKKKKNKQPRPENEGRKKKNQIQYIYRYLLLSKFTKDCLSFMRYSWAMMSLQC